MQVELNENFIGDIGNDSMQNRRDEYGRRLKLLGYRIYRAFKGGIPKGKFWLTDVIPAIRFRDAERLVSDLSKFKEKTGFIVWHPEEESGEKGHIHLYHICSYNQSNCRCAFLRNYKVKRRDPRRITQSDTIKANYFQNWFNYFLSPPRRILHIQINRVSDWREVYRLKDLRQSIIIEIDQTRNLLERSEFACEMFSGEEGLRRTNNQTDNGIIGGIENTSNSGYSNISRVGIVPRKQLANKIYDHDSLVSQIMNLCVVPFENSCNNELWIKDKYLRFYDNSDPDYKRACSTVRRSTTYLTLEELIKLHEDTSTFRYYYSSKPDYYLSTQESFEWVDKLLIHQYGDSVKDFLTRLINVTEKQLPKRNTMFIKGKPNCGKTWFVNMLAAFYLNVGNVKNFVRGQNFPFNDCVNRRILIWNEPSIMLSAFDTLKQLTEGDHISVAVKYQGDTVLHRTPLIFTSNKQIFNPTQEMWTSRIYFEEWKIAPFLKDCKQYPHPSCFKSLLNKYSIIG